MAPKADKGKKAPGKNSVAKETENKSSTKPKKQMEEDDDDLDDSEDEVETTAKKGKASVSSKKKSEDDDDDDAVSDGEDEVDDWDKVEEEEWDPDFEEFDVPKSKAKKAAGKKGEEEEDFKIDEEFKDMDLFNEGSSYDDDEDDF
jgi:nucleolin